MYDKDLTSILGRCLEEIAAGETPAACLARYPEHAAELAPLLAMAGELGTLGQYQVSDAARVRAKAQLRRAASAQCDQRSAPKGWLRPGSFLMPRVAAGLAFTLICVLLMAGIVAASGPGDLAYGLRIAAEQIPARLTPGAEARARAELRIASHRLAELDWTMGRQDQALDERTVSALVADVEMAAETAASLPEPERIDIAARIAEQAHTITQLAGSARRAQHAEALQLASVRAYRAAERVWAGPVSPAPLSPGLLREPTRTTTATPHGTSAPERTPSPNAPATATSLPTPTSAPSATRNRATPHDAGDQQATPQGRPSATAGRSTPEATASGRGPTATAPRPGLTPTSPSPGPTATSPGSGPVAPPPGPGPAATSPGPRPESPPGGPRGSRG
jgi:hypothetical protein